MEETDLSELRKKCLTNLYLCTENLAKYVDIDQEVEFEKLKRCVQQYCNLGAQQDVVLEAMEKAKAETDASNIDTFGERYQSYLNSLAKKRLRGDHPYILELNKRYQKTLQIVRNDMLEDSDLVLNESQSQQQYIDPCSKKPIKDPVKNTICGHYYDKDTIMELIQRNLRTKCPVAGCGNRNYIIPSHLISDEELRFRLSIPVHSTMIQDNNVMDFGDETL